MVYQRALAQNEQDWLLRYQFFLFHLSAIARTGRDLSLPEETGQRKGEESGPTTEGHLYREASIKTTGKANI